MIFLNLFPPYLLSCASPIWHAGEDQSLQYVMLEKPHFVLWERSCWRNTNLKGKDVGNINCTGEKTSSAGHESYLYCTKNLGQLWLVYTGLQGDFYMLQLIFVDSRHFTFKKNVGFLLHHWVMEWFMGICGYNMTYILILHNIEVNHFHSYKE